MERNRPGMEQIAGYMEQKRRQSERKSCLLERAWNRPSPARAAAAPGVPPGGGIAGNEGAPPQRRGREPMHRERREPGMANRARPPMHHYLQRLSPRGRPRVTATGSSNISLMGAP
jgi:hypothetical protein